MNQALVNIFTFLENIGLVDVLLPFCLVFAMSFGALERANIFGKGKRNVHLIIAFALSFMVVGVLAYVNIINKLSQYFGLAIIAILSFILIYGLFSSNLALIKKKTDKSSGSSGSGSGGSGSSSSSAKGPLTGNMEKVARRGPEDPPLNI